MSVGTALLLALCVGLSSGAEVALLIIDVQRCFTTGGGLEVKDGDEVVPIINDIREQHGGEFSMVVLTQDWHCDDHVSFASQHSGYNPYDVLSLRYTEQGELCRSPDVSGDYTVECGANDTTVELEQTLWPDHCVINSTKAQLHPQLTHRSTDGLVRKGYHCGIDSYSAFFDNGGFTRTELEQTLRDGEIDTVFIVGLATDFCCYYSAMDAHNLGFTTYFIEDATRGVAAESTAAALDDMKHRGIHVTQADKLPEVFANISSSASNQVKLLPMYLVTALLVCLLN